MQTVDVGRNIISVQEIYPDSLFPKCMVVQVLISHHVFVSGEGGSTGQSLLTSMLAMSAVRDEQQVHTADFMK